MRYETTSTSGATIYYTYGSASIEPSWTIGTIPMIVGVDMAAAPPPPPRAPEPEPEPLKLDLPRRIRLRP